MGNSKSAFQTRVEQKSERKKKSGRKTASQKFHRDQPARILVVDDHPVVRASICRLLEAMDEVVVVGQSGDGLDGLQQIEDLKPDLVVLDIEMPGMNGIDVARNVKLKELETKILIVSAHDASHYVAEIFAIGVAGYLLKDEAPQMIVDAVRGVISGERGWISHPIVSRMVETVSGGYQEPNHLAQREKEVLACIVNGQTNHEIAYQLHISQKTVEKYVFAIMNKLDVSSRTEAAVLAVRNQLL